MKKMSKSIFSVIMLLTLVLSFSLASVSADTGTATSKTPDALNPELQKAKLKQLGLLKSGVGNKTLASEKPLVKFDAAHPLTLNFDDGSSVTYSLSAQATAAGTMNWEITSSYTWLAGYAKITAHVDNAKVTVGTNGTKITLPTDTANDIYQTFNTGYAEVDNDKTIAKLLAFDLYNIGFKCKATGVITYEIVGIKHQTSYSFIWQVDPRDYSVTFVDTY